MNQGNSPRPMTRGRDPSDRVRQHMGRLPSIMHPGSVLLSPRGVDCFHPGCLPFVRLGGLDIIIVLSYMYGTYTYILTNPHEIDGHAIVRISRCVWGCRCPIRRSGPCAWMAHLNVKSISGTTSWLCVIFAPHFRFNRSADGLRSILLVAPQRSPAAGKDSHAFPS